ncbi:MAG: sugar transferase [Acidobacteria bacterium]|nr:sugar transferase [Acidobacteriota bacterium]
MDGSTAAAPARIVAAYSGIGRRTFARHQEVEWERAAPNEVLRRIQLRDYGSAAGIPQRIVESVVAAIGLVVTAPIMLLLALLIRLDSPGPALFRQKRVGKGGRLFTFVKFRTYYVDAKERFPEMYAYQYTPEQIEQLHFKIPNDQRATRMGRWLRKTTLDELPNLINVLLGDVALCGPRPEIPEMLPYYRPHELAKFAVRPGITGLAQISGRGRLSFRDTVSHDLDYVAGRSLSLDFKIIIRTIVLIVLRDGAF